MIIGRLPCYLLLWAMLAAPSIPAAPAMAAEQGTARLLQRGQRFWLVRQGQASCRVMNVVASNKALVVDTAIGQLNEYLSANYAVKLPTQSATQLPGSGDWIVTAVGAAPPGLADTAALGGGIGDQGFVLRQVAAPSGNGRWLVVWGKTPLGCRYGVMELLLSLQSEGKDCYCDLAHLRDEPAFTHRIYYHNFGEHLLNAFSVNMLHDVPFGRWTRADWRSYLEMIAAMRYTTFEFWLSPTLFSAPALTAKADSKYEAYAETMRWVIDQAHQLGLKVEVLICVNCTNPTWTNLCPRIPDQHREILALWSHWTKRLSNADVFCIFPGDVGGCHRNGCTHETFVDLCLEIIHGTQPNGSFTFEIATWGPPFFDWGVPAREASPERAKAAFDYLLKRVPDLPNSAVFSVNMNRDIGSLFSGAPKDPRYSNRAVVDRLRKLVPLLTWDYYLSEREDVAVPLYGVPELLQTRQEERRWGYCGGINYTRTPRLSVLTAFAAAEAYWNPDQSENDLLRKFSSYVFGNPEVAPEVFPSVAMVGQPNWKAFHENMRRATQALKTQIPSLCKLFVTPDAESYRQNLLFYATTYQRLAAVAMDVQEVVSLSKKAKLSEVKAWLAAAPEGRAKSRVLELLAGWGDFDLAAVTGQYRSRVYGVYDLSVGPEVRADLVNSHCNAFVAQFGITSFFDSAAN